MIMDRS